MTRILATWKHVTTDKEVAVVPPDGCVDLIIVHPQALKPYWFVSTLQSSCNAICLEAGLHMHGMRLKPGTQVNESILNLALATAASSDRANEYLDDACMFDRNVDVAIEALLKCGGSVSQTAAELGVTVRSLQRLFVQNALPTPSYWRSLARVRLAATNLDDTLSLAEHAIQLGFSDQAHMTREFGRWFGVTPAKFATDSQLQVALKQPGLAT